MLLRLGLDLVCTGAAIGLIAALISILTEWLASIKLGYCTTGWWLKEKFCCLGAEGDEHATCADWHEWGGGGPVAWFVYVTCAVSAPLTFLVGRAQGG